MISHYDDDTARLRTNAFAQPVTKRKRDIILECFEFYPILAFSYWYSTNYFTIVRCSLFELENNTRYSVCTVFIWWIVGATQRVAE